MTLGMQTLIVVQDLRRLCDPDLLSHADDLVQQTPRSHPFHAGLRLSCQYLVHEKYTSVTLTTRSMLPDLSHGTKYTILIVCVRASISRWLLDACRGGGIQRAQSNQTRRS